MLSHLVCSFVVALAPSVPSAASGSGTPLRVSELVDALEDATRVGPGREPDAARAVEVIEELRGRYEDSARGERRAIVGGLEALLHEADEPLLREVAMASAAALSSLGPDGTRPLAERIDDRKYTDDHEFQRQLILALGRTHDPDAVEPLLECLRHHEPAVQAAGAEALGEFHDLEQDRRKDVFYALLLRLVTAKDATDRNPADLVAKHRYDTIVGAINTSLQRLSGRDELGPERWTRFWNKHKKDDWDAERT